LFKSVDACSISGSDLHASTIYRPNLNRIYYEFYQTTGSWIVNYRPAKSMISGIVRYPVQC
jgi:hypothetical protein